MGYVEAVVTLVRNGYCYRFDAAVIPAIAPFEFRPECNAIRILQVLKGNVGLGQSKLFSLIQANRSSQTHDQRCKATLRPVWQVPAAGVALHIMV